MSLKCDIQSPQQQCDIQSPQQYQQQNHQQRKYQQHRSVGSSSRSTAAQHQQRPFADLPNCPRRDGCFILAEFDDAQNAEYFKKIGFDKFEIGFDKFEDRECLKGCEVSETESMNKDGSVVKKTNEPKPDSEYAHWGHESQELSRHETAGEHELYLTVGSARGCRRVLAGGVPIIRPCSEPRTSILREWYRAAGEGECSARHCFSDFGRVVGLPALTCRLHETDELSWDGSHFGKVYCVLEKDTPPLSLTIIRAW